MTEKEIIQFEKLLGKYIDFCGLDSIEICKKAQELKDLIDNNN